MKVTISRITPKIPHPKNLNFQNTMQLNITSLADTYAFQFSASRAEMGENAGRITWQNNLRESSTLLDSPEKLESFRDFVRSSGGWDRKEIAAMTPETLNALCHQWIMGDIREAPAILPGITISQDSLGAWYHESEDTPDFETGPFSTRSEAYRDAENNPPPSCASLEEIDWTEYEAQASAGRISSRLWFDGTEYFFDISE